jgi:uncharacterized protein (TIGR00730 family)
MPKPLRRVCVFCGSSNGANPLYRDAAIQFAQLLARRNLSLVYGGGRTGLMGAIADTALAQGIEVIGVMPQALIDKEVGHFGITDLRIVQSMHERKALMADLSDAFVALPGAFGTLDEFCEIVTWAQLRIHDKPCGLWNVNRFWDPLLAAFDHAMAEGFLKPAHRNLVIADENAENLLDRLLQHSAVEEDKWTELR